MSIKHNNLLMRQMVGTAISVTSEFLVPCVILAILC